MPPSTILTKIGGSLAFSRVHQPWRSKEGEFFCHHQKFMFIALILWVFPALFLCEKSCSIGSSPAKTTYYLATLHRVWENPIWEPSPKWMSFSENSIAFIISQFLCLWALFFKEAYLWCALLVYNSSFKSLVELLFMGYPISMLFWYCEEYTWPCTSIREVTLILENWVPILATLVW